MKRKAPEVIPVVTKRVRIAQGPIDFEELEHASVLLEEVRDEAVAPKPTGSGAQADRQRRPSRQAAAPKPTGSGVASHR